MKDVEKVCKACVAIRTLDPVAPLFRLVFFQQKRPVKVTENGEPQWNENAKDFVHKNAPVLGPSAAERGQNQVHERFQRNGQPAKRGAAELIVLLSEMLLFVLVAGVVEQHRVTVAHVLRFQLPLGLLAQVVGDAVVRVDRLDDGGLHQLDEVADETADQPHLHAGDVAGAGQFGSNLREDGGRL